ncbi:MAG: LysR family transcriptional regulator [Thiotrichaceae bacterium]|nr:LysR family transcriptional regulator [Thiotrichaceae bacterium]
MNLYNYQAFLVVYEMQSFTKAADKLFTTQPTISKRIAVLEKQLGKPLFDRIERKIILNEAGHALLPIAQNICLSIAESQRVINDLEGKVTGPLKLITSHHIGIHHLPTPLNIFTNTYPQVAIDLAFMGSEGAYREITSTHYELAMITLPPQDKKTINYIKLWTDPLVLAVGKEHPLLHNNPTELSDLSQYPAILPEQGTHTRQLIEQPFLHHRVRLKIGLETNYLETIRSMVQIGLGWSVLPQTMVNDSLESISLQGIEWQRELGIIHHAQCSLSNAAKCFIEQITKG